MRRSPGTTVDEPVELEIIRMRRRHLKGVMAIERQVYPRPWIPNLFLSEMSELRNRTYLVAKIGKDVVGYGGIMCYGEEAHVTTIAVDPEHHRRKIGTRLLYRPGPEAMRLRAPPAAPVPGGPGVELGGPALVQPVRIPARRDQEELLPRDRRGRRGHVGGQHPLFGISRAARAHH